MYYDDRETALCVRLIDYPVGSIEPRHVHAGTHATTVLKGRAIVDGVTLNPLDVVLGPGGEPHGPLHYPDGCQLLSAFQGSYFHSEVEHMSAEKRYRLVQADALPWVKQRDDGRETKTLIDHGCGPLLLQAQRFAPGAVLETDKALPFQSALVVDGKAVIDGEILGTWDYLRVPDAGHHGAIRFPDGALLLTITMRQQ